MKLSARLLVLTITTLFFLMSVFPVIAKEDTPESLAGAKKVTAEELIEITMSQPDLVLIDSRKPSDRNKGYIEGSVGLPNTETSSNTLAKHVKSKTTPVAFYCNGKKCGRSYKAAKIALDNGYSNIMWFRGGWDEWMIKGLPVTKD